MTSVPNAMSGALIASSDGVFLMDVALPSGLRDSAEVHVTVDGHAGAATPIAGVVRFSLPA